MDPENKNPVPEEPVDPTPVGPERPAVEMPAEFLQDMDDEAHDRVMQFLRRITDQEEDDKRPQPPL